MPSMSRRTGPAEKTYFMPSTTSAHGVVWIFPAARSSAALGARMGMDTTIAPDTRNVRQSKRNASPTGPLTKKMSGRLRPLSARMAKISDPTGAVPYMAARLSPLTASRWWRCTSVGTAASRAGWRMRANTSITTMRRKSWRSLRTKSKPRTSTARPKSDTIMVVFRLHRSAINPPRKPKKSPGTIRPTNGTRTAIVAPRPPPARRVARAKLANRLTQSPRLDIACDHQSRANGPLRIRSRPRWAIGVSIDNGNGNPETEHNERATTRHVAAALLSRRNRMSKTLVIVESPTKAKKISEYLGEDVIVEASMGHIRDLPRSAKEIPAKYKDEEWAKLGVNIDAGFEPLYVLTPNRRDNIKKLKKAAEEATEIYLATDEDREGEAIAWHLVEVLKPKVPVKRMVFHEITEPAIRHAFENPREIDERLVDAQEARRILDRLYGYEVSPVLWKKVATGLSAGRVQSVAVRIVVERERERMAFRSAAYWDIVGRFAKDGDPSTFDATLTSVDGARIATGRDFDS